MKAIVQDRYGSAEVLEAQEIDKPEIGDNEVLVRVHAASIHVGDWILMTGSPFIMRLATGLRKPKNRVPGTDVAGTVEAVGKDVTQLRPGDDVFGWAAGAFAEYAAAPGGPVRQEAGQPDVRAGGLSRRVGLDRPPAPSRRRQGPAGAEGPDQRGVRRRRHVRRPDRQGVRCRGDRRVQHEEPRDGPLHRCRPRHRLHPRGLHDAARALRPDPRQRRQPLDGPDPARADTRAGC